MTSPGVPRSLGLEASGCRDRYKPGKPRTPSPLTSTVDAPAHSAPARLLAARGRRRDQHRRGRTAPGVPGGAGRGGAPSSQSDGRIPAPNGAADWLRGETITQPGAVALKGPVASCPSGRRRLPGGPAWEVEDIWGSKELGTACTRTSGLCRWRWGCR